MRGGRRAVMRGGGDPPSPIRPTVGRPPRRRGVRSSPVACPGSRRRRGGRPVSGGRGGRRARRIALATVTLFALSLLTVTSGARASATVGDTTLHGWQGTLHEQVH